MKKLSMYLTMFVFLFANIAPTGTAITANAVTGTISETAENATSESSTTESTASESEAESTTEIAKVKGLKIKDKKNKVVFVWKKVKGAKRYQLQISTDENFKKGVKDFKVKGLKKAYSVKKLKINEMYYVRVRAIGENETGEWSSTKSVVRLKK